MDQDVETQHPPTYREVVVGKTQEEGQALEGSLGGDGGILFRLPAVSTALWTRLRCTGHSSNAVAALATERCLGSVGIPIDEDAVNEGN